MGKVKSNFGFINKLTCLLNMSAKHLTKCSLKKMSGSMVAHN